MNYSPILKCLVLFILTSCTSDTISVDVPESASMLPVTVARQFKGNTLTVSAAGVPPLAISLVRKDSIIYTDFLAANGDVAINVGPMRSDFGKYDILVQDATNRDTSMTISIDQYAPGTYRRKTSSTGQGQKTRSTRIKGDFVYLRDEKINHYTRAYIKCTECGIEAELYYPMKGSYWACDKFQNDLYRFQHVAARETCKKLCGG